MRPPVAPRTSADQPGDFGPSELASAATGKFLPVLAGSLVCLGAAQAVDATQWLVFSAGPLRLKPQLTVGEEFNDNILYFSKADARYDLITTVSPGLVLDLGRQENPLSARLGYGYDEQFYARTKELNHGDHHVAFSARFQKSRLSIQALDSFDLLSGPISFSSAPGDVNAVNLLGRKVDRFLWSDRYHANYALTEKTFMGLGVTHSRADYQSGVSTYDFESLRGSVDFGYQATEKYAVFGQTYYGVTSAESNLGAGPAPDMSAIGGYLGVRGQFTSKLSGTIQAGLESRSFDGNPDAQISPVAEVDVAYAMTERRNFTLSYSRSSSVSVESAAYSYVTDVVGLTCRQALGTRDKLSVLLGAYTRFTAYDQLVAGIAREDRHYSFNATLNYRFDLWLTGSVGYAYERLDTNSGGIVDYGVNRVTLKLTLGY